MKTVAIDEMANLLSGQAADAQPVVVTVHGQPYAAVVPITSLHTGSSDPAVAALKTLLRIMLHTMPADEYSNALEDAFIDTNPKLINILEQSRADIETNGGYSEEELRRELGLPSLANS